MSHTGKEDRDLETLAWGMLLIWGRTWTHVKIGYIQPELPMTSSPALL
jgi:hypothetical protein